MTDKPTLDERAQVSRSGYSIASLLLMTALAAVLVAAICQVYAAEYRIDYDWLDAGAIVGGLIGLIVGLTVGLGHDRKLRGLLIGIPGGICFGVAAGLLSVSPNHLPVAAVGSVVLVLFAIVVRYLSDRPPASEK